MGGEDYSSIIMANPGVPIESVFESGISLAIPIIQQQSVLTSDLPPWKTAATTVPAA